LCSS